MFFTTSRDRPRVQGTAKKLTSLLYSSGSFLRRDNMFITRSGLCICVYLFNSVNISVFGISRIMECTLLSL